MAGERAKLLKRVTAGSARVARLSAEGLCALPGAAGSRSRGDKSSYQLFIESAYEQRRKGKINKGTDFPETVFFNKQIQKKPQTFFSAL